jgi:UDP-N-acetylglucosamine--N-acetylmuramyl-(pentapeptide) pyrophosphoryl-undecaprenol N-acetylglucosamine transferase
VGETQTLLVAGGGTGGHIYPAIAIAQEYLAGDAARRVVFVGTQYGLEKNIVPKAGFPLEFIDVGGLKGKSLAQTAKNLLKLPLSLLSSWRLISRHRPVAILGVGGYASGPVVMAGALRRIPTIVHESNAFPGATNRLLSKFVTRVAVGFADAIPRLGGKGDVTGNPIRKEFFANAAVDHRTTSDSRPDDRAGVRRLLIFGGSQGSRIINTSITGALALLADLRQSLEIVHQTGPGEHPKVAEAYAASPFANARVVPYLDAMWEEIGAADVVVCRSGAMTVGELCAAGRASILIPFAAAADNHQEFNARTVEHAGGAVVITEKELTPERLAAAIREVLADPERARRMGQAARSLAVPGASRKVVEIIEKIQRK